MKTPLVIAAAVIANYFLLALPGKAQAPSTVAGDGFLVTATNGTYPLASNGYSFLLPASSGSSYRLLGIYNVTDTGGTYSYAKSGSNTATLTLNQASNGVVSSVSLTFQTANQATFYDEVTAPPASAGLNQSGSFAGAYGTALPSIVGKKCHFLVSDGLDPFASTGDYTIAFSTANSYGVYTNGVLAVAGKYSYSILNRSTATLQLTNPVTGSSTAFLGFANASSGVFALRQPSTGGFQVGTFAVLEQIPPVISITSPKSGQLWSNAVFTVTGTAKDNVGVVAVSCLTNGTWGLATTANGWTNWSVSVALVPGTNVVSAYAADAAGNHSSTNTVRIVYLLTDRLQVAAVGQGKLTPNYSNAVLVIANRYSMKATGVNGYVFTNWVISTNWTGGVISNTATLSFLMQSNLTVLANFVDVTKPAVKITSPAANQQCSNALFTIKGTATDNAAVQQVQYNLNNAGWQAAGGQTNWSAQVLLSKGTNILQVFAVDTAGNQSATSTVRFIYNQFLVLGGAYNGLFYPTNGVGATNCGAITLTMGSTVQGLFSGKLFLAATNLSFSGAFNSGLQAALVNVPGSGKPPISMALQLYPVWQDPTTQVMHSNVVTGTVAAGTNWASDLLAFRAFSGKTSSYAGNYTLLIQGSGAPADSPPGDGAATAVVGSTGAVQVKGNLADKTPLVYSTALSADGLWPMFVSLYGGRGLFIEWMGCDTNQTTITTTNAWLKPPGVPKDPINTNGFAISSPGLLSKYTPAAAGQNAVNWSVGTVVLEFGNLAQPQTNYVTVSNNIVGVTGGTISNLTFGITNKYGTFGGSFKHPATNVPVKFSGVLVQGDPINDVFGGGWFVGPNEGGSVRFESAAAEDWAPDSLALTILQLTPQAQGSLRLCLDTNTFSVHDNGEHGMGKYTWQKLGRNRGQLATTYDAPPEWVTNRIILDIVFTAPDAGTFACDQTGFPCASGTFSVLPPVAIAPESLAGETAVLTVTGETNSTVILSSAGTFTETQPPSLTASGTWNYTRYSGIGGLLLLNFSSPTSLVGATNWLECQFNTPTDGLFINTLQQPGRPIQEGYGSFTLTP